LQSEQFVTAADHTIEARFRQSEISQEVGPVRFIELRNFRLDGRADWHHNGPFFCRQLVDGIQVRIVIEPVLINIGNVHDRLCRQQLQVAQASFSFSSSGMAAPACPRRVVP
jgi:hypothetical protein